MIQKVNAAVGDRRSRVAGVDGSAPANLRAAGRKCFENARLAPDSVALGAEPLRPVIGVRDERHQRTQRGQRREPWSKAGTRSCHESGISGRVGANQREATTSTALPGVLDYPLSGNSYFWRTGTGGRMPPSLAERGHDGSLLSLAVHRFYPFCSRWKVAKIEPRFLSVSMYFMSL